MLVLNHTEWTRHRLAMVRRHLEEWTALLSVERQRRITIGGQHRQQLRQLVRKQAAPYEKAQFVIRQMGEIATLNHQHRTLRQQLKTKQHTELAVLDKNERIGKSSELLPY